MADEVVTGGRDRKLQKRAQRGDGWTAKRRAIFLDHLAATCNVTQASRAAGMWNNSVYALRQRDPAFAAQWRAALVAGYERLEAMLIERATLGTRAADADALALGETPVPDCATMDTELAKWLLSRHGERTGGKPRAAGGRVTRATEAETDAALVKQLKALQRRRGGLAGAGDRDGVGVGDGGAGGRGGARREGQGDAAGDGRGDARALDRQRAKAGAGAVAGAGAGEEAGEDAGGHAGGAGRAGRGAGRS